MNNFFLHALSLRQPEFLQMDQEVEPPPTPMKEEISKAAEFVGGVYYGCPQDMEDEKENPRRKKGREDNL